MVQSQNAGETGCSNLQCLGGRCSGNTEGSEFPLHWCRSNNRIYPPGKLVVLWFLYTNLLHFISLCCSVSMLHVGRLWYGWRSVVTWPNGPSSLLSSLNRSVTCTVSKALLWGKLDVPFFDCPKFFYDNEMHCFVDGQRIWYTELKNQVGCSRQSSYNAAEYLKSRGKADGVHNLPAQLENRHWWTAGCVQTTGFVSGFIATATACLGLARDLFNAIITCY